jgi:hypothetical protein
LGDVRSRFITLGVVLAGLGISGIPARWLEAPLWKELRIRQPLSRADSLQGGLGQGLSLGLFGGLRALMADLLWLRVNLSWEQRRLPDTLGNLHLVTVVDPRPLVFWLNGARMMAYDMPSWRIDSLGGRAGTSAGLQERIETEQARQALAWLDKALEFHPASAAIFIERANIYLNCWRDLGAAAADYRRAAEQPDAPYYAARLHGELLRRLGRKREALAWLEQLHPRLPRGDEAAAAGLVLSRIRELEEELGVASEQRYLPRG